MAGLEPTTSFLPRKYTTAVLHQHIKRDTILDECSTNELITHVRNTGVEPVTYRLDSICCAYP